MNPPVAGSVQMRAESAAKFKVKLTHGPSGSREGISWGEASAEVEKRMETNPRRRIGELNLEIQMPSGLTREQRARLEEVGRNCPVALSLHPDLRMPIRFSYPD